MDSPASNIDTLFVTLAATYGSAWDRSLGTAPMLDVKTVWGSHLAGFNVADIRYALDHLSAKCPNVFEFRDLCRAAPRKDALRIEAPKADPAVIAGELERQLGVRQAIASSVHDPKGWARSFVSRAEAGERIRPITLKFARQALGLSAA